MKPTTAIALFVAALAGAVPTLTMAQDNPLSFNAALTSDYRYRGISQSRLKPAVSAGADYALPNGLYVGTWLSTIKWIKDAGTLGGVSTGSANLEWDIYGGYKGEIQKDLGYDVGLLTYIYPGNKYANLGAKNANTTEIYGALSFGPATVKYSHSLTSLFGAGTATVNSKNSGYLEASATFDLGGVSVTPHIGRQKITNFGDFSYTDYALTVATDYAGFTFSGAIVGADTKTLVGTPNGYAYFTPSGKDLGRTGLVLTVKKTF